MANGTSDTTNGNTPTTPGAHHIEIKDADAVQAGLAGGFNWIEDNAKIFVALIVCAILGGLGYVGVQYVGRRQEAQAQDAYYKVESSFMKKREEFERSKYKAFMPAEQTKDMPAAAAATGDLGKDYGSLITDLEKVATEHAGTAAGGQAAILVAETYLTYKQPEKAIELAQLPANKLSKDHTIGQLGRVIWGNALAAKGDCAAAVTVWQPLLNLKDASFLQSDVAVRSGLCFEQLGQTDNAMEMYRKASAASPDAAAATTAKGLLRALEFKGATTTASAAASAAAPTTPETAPVTAPVAAEKAK